MSFKIPCGGFKLDEKSFSLDKNGALSIPKPLTYDYMPEGYPSKSVETVTLMEEQEVAFTEKEGLMEAVSPVALDIKLGDKLTVVWDGVSYNVTALDIGPSEAFAFGNLGLTGIGDTEDYPFVYMMFNSKAQWATSGTATSHTIKVMRQQVTITPMSTDFIPKNLNVVFTKNSTDGSISCNVTYNQLRAWIASAMPIFATYKSSAGTSVENIIKYTIETNALNFYYRNSLAGFTYNSDGTIIELQPS